MPNFTLPDLTVKKVSLSDYKGKLAVLEWFNPGCPFVKQVHKAGGIFETRAAQEAKEGTVWLAVNSGAPGNQGNRRREKQSGRRQMEPHEPPHPAR